MKRLLGTSLALAVALGTMAAPVGAAEGEHQKADTTVMTRNLYLGVDLLPLLSSANIGELSENAGAAFSAVVATDFATRAEALGIVDRERIGEIAQRFGGAALDDELERRQALLADPGPALSRCRDGQDDQGQRDEQHTQRRCHDRPP